MWNNIDTDIRDDHVTRSAGAALLCSLLTRHLSDRRAELQLSSETLCWIILPIVFKVAATNTDGKHRPEKGDIISWSAMKKLPASPLSLWVVSLCLGLYCFLTDEDALIAFLPALTPMLLVSQTFLFWHDTEIPAASPPISQVFLCLSKSGFGSVLVALFAILTLKSDWQIRVSDAPSVVPVAALLVAYLTLDPRPRISNRYYRILPPFDIEDALVPLSLRVTLVLVTILGLETLAFGFPVFSAYTPALALTKALSWYFTIRTVCIPPWNFYMVVILIRCKGSTLVLAYCSRHGNIQYSIHSGPLHDPFRFASFISRFGIFSVTRSDYPDASESSESQASTLGFLPCASRPLPFQHIYHRDHTAVINIDTSSRPSHPESGTKCQKRFRNLNT